MHCNKACNPSALFEWVISFFIYLPAGEACSEQSRLILHLYVHLFPYDSNYTKEQMSQGVFFSLFAYVMILFSSSCSVSANNWVTLMGHDMYKAWHVGMLWHWCCSERKASSSCCFVSQCFIYFSTLVTSCMNPPHLALCLLSITLHPSINTHSDGGLFFLPSPPLFGVLWKVIKRVHFHTYFSQPGWQQALLLLFSVLERSLWQPCLQLYVLLCGK